MSTLVTVTPSAGKRRTFLHSVLYCQYNCQYIPYYLTFSLNNEMLRELYYLYDKIKHNLYCKRYSENGILIHRFPKGWTNLECHQQYKKCINNHENVHMVIMNHPATLLLELS